MQSKILDSLVSTAKERYQGRFAKAPTWVVAAPGRVNIIGEHTDYNAGFVLPMAIDRHIVIAAGPIQDGARAQIFSGIKDEHAALSLNVPITPSTPTWVNYVRGVVAGCQARGMRIEPFAAVIESNLPEGGGLSSSAALEVAMATLAEAMTGRTIPSLEKAFLCQKAEHEFAGVPCGIMDQITSVMGTKDCLLLIDCRTHDVLPIVLADEWEILVTDCNVKHTLASGAYAERRNQCEAAARALGVETLREVSSQRLEADRKRLDEVEYRRARHVVTEIARTTEAAELIRRGEWQKLGELMYASHASLRDDFEVSSPELDVLVSSAKSIGLERGVIGSRMTGGGFGGCTVTLVHRRTGQEIAEIISDEYHRQTGKTATWFLTRPVGGTVLTSLTMENA